jgi:hypothetical protein
MPRGHKKGVGRIVIPLPATAWFPLHLEYGKNPDEGVKTHIVLPYGGR